MQLIVPLPFGEIRIGVHKTRRTRPLFWCVVLSAFLHVLALWLIGAAIFRTIVPLATPKQQPVMVSISSAQRVEPRARPMRAQHPIERPRPIPVRPHAAAAHARPAAQPHRPELSKPVRVAYVRPQTQTLTPAQIDAQTRSFERTIERARLANDPVAGAATGSVVPAAPKRLALNVQGDFGRPRAEGVLYPLKRWTDGPWVYYYVRYDAEYADGSTESGVVPWPIRFPVGSDPFARGVHRMPLPGPLPGYVLPDGVALDPLVKNCFDRHYDYCPIEHE